MDQPARGAGRVADAGAEPRRVSPRRRGWTGFLTGPVLPGLVLTGLGWGLYTSSGRDDAFLTYWPAYTLAKFGEIVNVNGERVEQSSSLLHTVLLAGTTFVPGLGLSTAGWLIGLVAGIATVVLVWHLDRSLLRSQAGFAALVAATATPILYWSLGGLETTFAAALLLAAVACGGWFLEADGPPTRRCTACTVVSVVAFALVRPEAGPILLCTFGGTVLAWLAITARGRRPRGVVIRRALVLFAIAGVSILAVTLFRLAYFGDAFPRPVSSKTNGLQVGAGIRYVRDTLWHTNPIGFVVLAIAALGLVRIVRDARPLGLLVACAALAELGFVIAVGGDWMEGGRFLVALVALAAVLVGAGLTFLGMPARAWVGVGIILLQVVGAVRFAHDGSTGAPIWSDPRTPVALLAGSPAFGFAETHNKVHLRDSTMIAPLRRVIDDLRRHGVDPVTVASEQAGMAPFYVFRDEYGHARFVDLLNHATDAFADCPWLLHRVRSVTQVYLGEWIADTRCKVPEPDVFYDLGTFEQVDPAVRDRYALVYEQRGDVTSGSRILPGGTVGANQFIAVRRDLADEVRNLSPHAGGG